MTIQERALDWTLLISACNSNDRKIMHQNLRNLIFTERLGKYGERLLKHLDTDFKDVAKKEPTKE